MLTPVRPVLIIYKTKAPSAYQKALPCKAERLNRSFRWAEAQCAVRLIAFDLPSTAHQASRRAHYYSSGKQCSREE